MKGELSERAHREMQRINASWQKQADGGHADRWRKKRGIARILTEDGNIYTAEIHWCEAHGIGRKEAKIKRILR